MTDQKISQLAPVTALAGPELVPVVQGGNTVAATAAQIAALGIPSTVLTGILTTDFIFVIRNGTPYIATVASVLAATTNPGSGQPGTAKGQLNFSTPANSGEYDGVLS